MCKDKTSACRSHTSMPGKNKSVVSDFRARRGWFENFKRRIIIHSVTSCGNVRDLTTLGPKSLCLNKRLRKGPLYPQEVFNCDETGLIWKAMPKKIFTIVVR